MTAAKDITRITLFKIEETKDQETLIGIYKAMPGKAKKDGKPYITSVIAGPTFDDQRRQGYTIAVVSQFRSVEDMAYYDNNCEAHAELKAFAKNVHKGVMMTYFENALE